ncbi:hypothetical protein EON67_06135 [archaeon]|nr:MAG: hypothetical protein EON67_06135 [archaeon]
MLVLAAHCRPPPPAILSAPTLVQQVENLLYHMHDTMHLPWWATIVGATLVLRTALAFVNIGLMRNSLRMKIITPEIEKYARTRCTCAGSSSRVASLNSITLCPCASLHAGLSTRSCTPRAMRRRWMPRCA